MIRMNLSKGSVFVSHSLTFLFALISLVLGLGSASKAADSPPARTPSATPEFVIPRLVGSGPIPPREVLSLKELRQYRAALAPRLIADHMDFPLMVRPSDPVVQDMLSAPECARFGQDFRIQLYSAWCGRASWPVLDLLKQELKRQGLDQSRSEGRIELDLCTFLVNVEALCELIDLCSAAPEEAREILKQRIRELEKAAVLLLQFKEATLNGLDSLETIDRAALSPEVRSGPGAFERLVAASEGMREEDTRALLDIRDTQDFSRLSLERTAELLGKKATLEQARRRLAEMSPSEAITMAAYFARSRFQSYANPEQQMQTLSLEDRSDSLDAWLQVGDCRHFAGLAVHFLNHVVKPVNPQLEHWYFGVQSTHIRTYHHAYVKAVCVPPKGERLRLFFFDPTVLANQPLRRLTPRKVQRLIEATSRNDHYFTLKQYAEDLVAAPLDADVTFDPQEFPLDNGRGVVDLAPLIRERP